MASVPDVLGPSAAVLVTRLEALVKGDGFANDLEGVWNTGDVCGTPTELVLLTSLPAELVSRPECCMISAS